MDRIQDLLSVAFKVIDYDCYMYFVSNSMDCVYRSLYDFLLVLTPYLMGRDLGGTGGRSPKI